MENIKRQSCEGLALPFLLNWLLGESQLLDAYFHYTDRLDDSANDIRS